MIALHDKDIMPSLKRTYFFLHLSAKTSRPNQVKRDILAPLQLDTQTRNQELRNSITDSMLISLTVGKVDAGVAVLLTEDKRLVSPTDAPRRARRALVY